MTSRRVAVIVVVAVLVLAAVWFFMVRRVQPAQQASSAPPPPPHKLPTPGACAVNNTPGSGYELADCPATCVPASVTTAQNVPYDIDAYVNSGTDPDVCVRPKRGDTITFSANTSNGREVNVAGYQSNGRPASPFPPGVFPLPVPASGHTPPQHFRQNLPPTTTGKCWEFHGSFDVKDSQGQKCYDPHIYTDATP